MGKKRKIPVQKVVDDLTLERLSDRKIMKKYALNHREYIFILGKLAEKRKISFKRVIFTIRRFIEKEDLQSAEECIAVFRKNFSGLWGVQTIVTGLEHELFKTKSRLEFQRDMEKVSKSLAWFDYEYPGAPLHNSVISSVRLLENYSEKMLKNGSLLVNTQPPFDALSRLRLYPRYIHKFEKYQPAEATRMWHFIAVELFLQNDVDNFMIKSMMDAETCDVCMHLDGTRMLTAEVFEAGDQNKKPGKVLPRKPFPSLHNVEDLSNHEKARVLFENGWRLPPFCDNCRCQIFPCL